MTKTFLQAEWRKLVMVNYSVEKKLLEPFIPCRTEIELWNDICYVSLVGFMFLQTRIKGFKIPFHTNFEEVNLRCYVRYKDKEEWKRGVVFIKEIVPRHALTFVANALYKENYQTLPMRHAWLNQDESLSIEYKWKKRTWNSIKVIADKTPQHIFMNSEEEFITEHFWGYTKINEKKTSEYGVEHPRWETYKTKEYMIDVNFADTYGSDFAFLQSQTPMSVFLAEGSEIVVKEGNYI